MLSCTLKVQGRKQFFSNNRGDTIVEVLIAISIISLVLVSAYTVTNRNALAAQKVQEQGQAQRLVERQIELLRGFRGTIPADSCMISTGGVLSLGSLTACQLQTAGSGATYTVNIQPKLDSVYQISAEWDALNGKRASVTMYYRR